MRDAVSAAVSNRILTNSSACLWQLGLGSFVQAAWNKELHHVISCNGQDLWLHLLYALLTAVSINHFYSKDAIPSL